MPPSTPPTAPSTTTDRSAGHQHDRHCYWDHMECGWVCGPRPAAESVATRSGEPEREPERRLAAAR
jgi:hypothetical protein